MLYSRHYSRVALDDARLRMAKAEYREGEHFWLRETDGKMVEVHLRDDLLPPEECTSLRPWRVTLRREDGEELVDTYTARRPDQAAAWFRGDATWGSDLECEVVEVVPA